MTHHYPPTTDQEENSIPSNHIPDNDTTSSIIESCIAFIQTLSSFTGGLRSVGAMMVVGAMCLFLFDTVQGDDVSRYHQLLIQTLLLAGGGLLTSSFLKDMRGGRMFLGLALISIATNMATLGALIYSHVQWGGDRLQHHYPAFAKWIATDLSISDFMLLSAAGIAVMIPISVLVFRIMARDAAFKLTLLFCLCNLLLLIPFRESIGLALIASFAVILPTLFLKRYGAPSPLTRTGEGVFSVLCLFLPAMIIMARSLALYDMDPILTLIISTVMLLSLRTLFYSIIETAIMQKVVFALLMLNAIWFASSIAQLIDLYDNAVFGLTLGAILYSMGQKSPHHRSFYIRGAFFWAALCITIESITMLTLTLSLITLFFGIIALTVAYRERDNFLLLLGSVMSFIGIIHPLAHFSPIIDLSNWSHLALGGAILIIMAAFIERYGPIAKMRYRQWQIDTEQEDSP